MLGVRREASRQKRRTQTVRLLLLSGGRFMGSTRRVWQIPHGHDEKPCDESHAGQNDDEDRHRDSFTAVTVKPSRIVISLWGGNRWKKTYMMAMATTRKKSVRAKRRGVLTSASGKGEKRYAAIILRDL